VEAGCKTGVENSEEADGVDGAEDFVGPLKTQLPSSEWAGGLPMSCSSSSAGILPHLT